MSKDMNSFSFTGRLVKDATKKTVGAYDVVEANVANNIGFGQNAKVNYFKVQLWGKIGTGVFPYLKKGQMVGVAGELFLNKWTGGDMVQHQEMVVNGSTLVLLGSAQPETKEEHPAEENEVEVF